MKRLFKSGEEAQKVADCLQLLGYWVEIKSDRLPDDTDYYYTIRIVGYDN